MAAVTAGVVATLGAGYMGAQGARSAGRAGERAANAGVAEQQAAREQFQQNIEPYLGFGQEGINRLTAMLNNPNTLMDDPSYQWRFNQGLNAVDRSASAGGRLGSGGHSVDLLNYGQGAASQEWGNQWNRLMGIAGMGQNAAVGAGSLGQQAASNIGSLYGNAGQAQANAAMGQANAWGNALGGLSGFAGMYGGSRKSAFQPSGQYGAFTPSGNLTGYASGNSLIDRPANSWNFGNR